MFSLSLDPSPVQVRVGFTKGPATSGQASLKLEWSDFCITALEKFAERKLRLLAALGEADKDAVNHAHRTLRSEYDDEASGVLGPWSK
jgi:hypothetical protein